MTEGHESWTDESLKDYWPCRCVGFRRTAGGTWGDSALVVAAAAAAVAEGDLALTAFSAGLIAASEACCLTAS